MKRKLCIGFILCVFVLLGACSFMQEDLTADQRCYAALKSLNDNIEDYNTQFKLASPETQAKWKELIDPAIINANEALSLWCDSAGSDNEIDKEQAWIKSKDYLMMLLFKYGILSVEGK